MAKLEFELTRRISIKILRERYPMTSFEEVVTRLYDSQSFKTLDANMGYYRINLSDESSNL
ncbi:hypothetical protein DPMN_104357 [Dreissena polymorpha]|uniref:Reverse transcriptase n=1 Tax=Dreissena polymorpha TaxID=45954 RepID=A0A9D4K127_DREPO|nr:hypothetical protein DPMN_104357 [Dreissena polymorpha]